MFFKKKKERPLKTLAPQQIPQHVAIIMDGNGRWAQQRALPRTFGHREGGKVIKKISKYCVHLGIEYLTLFAFSTENWKRPPEEVSFLMDLLVDYLSNIDEHLEGKEVRVQVIGERNALSERVQAEIEKVEEKTRKYKDLKLTLAINYGGRLEILRAMQNIAENVQNGGIRPADICVEDIQNKLFTAQMPDPDILIRTGGEMRLSNFLLWQSAYTELFFIDKFWPDFSESTLDEILDAYRLRNRRFGGI